MGSALNSNDGSYIVIEQGDSIALYGWAINTEENQPVDDIYMEINNKYVKGIYGLPMPEIQKKFKIKSSSEIGFLFYFDRSLLKDENGQYCNKLRFHLMNHGVNFVHFRNAFFAFSRASMSRSHQSSNSGSSTWHSG